MNKKILRDLERQSGIDVYGLGLDRDKWETKLSLFAQLIVRECGVALNPPVQVRDVISRGQAYNLIRKHFGVEE